MSKIKYDYGPGFMKAMYMNMGKIVSIRAQNYHGGEMTQ